MIAADKDALLCDLAETYGILDYKALPVSLLATLCSGLRGNSRIKLKLAGVNTDQTTALIAAVADRLSLLVWMQSEDGVHKRNRPKSILSVLLGEQSAVKAFDTAADFEAARARILGGA